MVVAYIVAYIAYQQWRTNHQKYKMALFDRRYKIYDATVEYVISSFEKFKHEKWKEFHKEVSSARFLFKDKKVLPFMIKVATTGQKIERLRRRKDPETFMVEFAAFSDLSKKERIKAKELLSSLFEMRQEAINVFTKSLTLGF